MHEFSTTPISCTELEMENSGQMCECLLTKILMGIWLISVSPIGIRLFDFPPRYVDTKLAQYRVHLLVVNLVRHLDFKVR